jgi:hypothetical protein
LLLVHACSLRRLMTESGLKPVQQSGGRVPVLRTGCCYDLTALVSREEL